MTAIQIECSHETTRRALEQAIGIVDNLGEMSDTNRTWIGDVLESLLGRVPAGADRIGTRHGIGMMLDQDTAQLLLKASRRHGFAKAGLIIKRQNPPRL